MNGAAGQPRSFDPLDRLLNAQSYRLAHWRVASEEINYRRFFDVNELAALRMEDPVVFDEVHRFAFELVRRGAVTGLRIDHVDGLFAPGDYLRRLQRALCLRRRRSVLHRGREDPRPGERLASDWPVHGTTGYEFSATVNNLFVDRRHERAFDDLYRRIISDRRLSFSDLVYRCKKQVLHETMSGDINSLGHQLNRFSERNRHYRDFTLYSLISTMKEVIASFPVYRTYITADEPVSDHDRRYIVEAVRTGAVAGAGSQPADVRLHRAAAAQGHGVGDARGRRGAGTVHRQAAADDRPGRRQRDRGHGAVSIQSPGVAERSRRRSDAVRAGAGGRPRLDDRAAAAVALRALDDLDPRHQARRGRARADQRPVGDARRVEVGADALARRQSALQDRDQRRAGA